MEGRYERLYSNKLGSPTTSREIGSLTQSSAEESSFIGSSSGVYFINTVKQAFEASAPQSCKYGCMPAAEQTVGGEEDHEVTTRTSAQEFQLAVGPRQSVRTTSLANLGPFPTYERAQRYAIEYFARWHPLFPFLSGPAFLHELQQTYQGSNILDIPGQVQVDRTQLCNLIIIRCVLMIGAQYDPIPEDISNANPSRSHLLSTVCMLASRHDVMTLQTILAAELYCVSTLALRTASTLSGMMARLLTHAGFHRCPYRYDLSEEQRNLRKRIFWSFFTLDRYLCVSLGIPVALADSDIDVCVSGRREIHTPDSSLSAADRSGTVDASRDGYQGAETHHVPPDHDGVNGDEILSETQKAERGIAGNREETLACLVEFNTLVGRALDIFHKSIHIRRYDPEDVLYLRSDVEKWYNGLPDANTLNPDASKHDGQTLSFLPFFHVMYDRITISINRPALSLPRSLPEFQHSLQITIRAAKSIISGLEKQPDLFWPGYLASVWMSGLILSFASQIGLYNVTQASSEVQRCLALLSRMGQRWDSVKHCHAALSVLHGQLREPQQHLSTDPDMQIPSAKRKKRDVESTDPSTDELLAPSDTHAPPAERVAAGMSYDWTAMGEESAEAQNLELHMNDFFHDLSWDNLFDRGAYANQDGFLFEY